MDPELITVMNNCNDHHLRLLNKDMYNQDEQDQREFTRHP
jgi:hypothetical protein